MSRRARSRSEVRYAVRVDGRVVVGFRNVPADAKTVIGPDERSLAPCCIALLGPDKPYEWDEPNAAHFVAQVLGGNVEIVGGREPPEGWDAP